MEERPPLDSFFKGSNQVTSFPKLNPSKASTSLPSATPSPTSPTEEPQSFFGKAKDYAVGAAKGLGTSLLDVAQLASRTPVAPVGLNFGSSPMVEGAFDQARGALSATNAAQQTAKSAEQLAELFVPFMGLGAKAVTKLPAIARSLEETSLRLTPAMKRDLGDKVDRVKEWLVQNKITGSPEKRADMVSEIHDATEGTLEKFLKTYNTAKGFFVPKEVFVKDLKSLKSDPRFRDNRDFEVIMKQIDDAIANVNSIFKQGRIPVDRFNNYKRTIFANAFNKAGTKVLDDVEFAIGDAAKSLLEKSLRGLKIDGKDIEAFNREYGTIITARKILFEAANKNQVGNWGKLVSAILGAGIGASTGGGMGAVVGGAAGPMLAPMVAGTAVRSNVGQMAETIGKLAPAAKKALGTLLLGGTAVSTSRLERLLQTSPDGEPVQEDPQVSLEERQSLDSFYQK